jgi:hypothetical protein
MATIGTATATTQPSRILKESWIDSFKRYMEEVDAPDQYIFWSGISALSAVMKRNCFYQRKKQIVYPNHYIVLVGGPGTGKGSAMMPVQEILRKSGACNLLYDRMSAEDLVTKIAHGFGTATSIGGQLKFGVGDTSCCIYEDELSALFGISDWMIDCFNRLWTDGYFKYSTKSGGSVEVVNNATTIIGGCVPEYLKNISRTKSTATVSTGFTSRTIFSFASERPSALDYWGDDPRKKSSISEDDLIEDLKYIATYCGGRYEFDDESKKLIADFDALVRNDRDSNGNIIYESDVVRYFKNRISTHVGKLSMLLTASGNDTKIIRADTVRIAIRELTRVKDDLDIAFRFLGESKDVEAQARVVDFIERKGRTSRSEILTYLKNHVTADQLDRILYVLAEAMIVDLVSNGSGKTGVMYVSSDERERRMQVMSGII